MMKSTRTSVIALVMTLIGVALLCDTTRAREVRCKLLQQKLGRLYFSAGKEEDIFPGCRWVIYRDSTDTLNPILQGKIAQSYDGMSVSDSGNGGLNLIDIASVATIHGADTNFEPICIGAAIDNVVDAFFSPGSEPVNFISPGRLFSMDEKRSGFSDRRGLNRGTNYYGYPSKEHSTFISVIPESFEAQDRQLGLDCWNPTADVMVNYSGRPCEYRELHDSTIAPFMAAIIPTVSRPINRNALLTTALRYRMDSNQLNTIFGMEAAPYRSFIQADSGYVGFLPDLQKSKALLKEGRVTGSTVAIDQNSPALFKVAAFLRSTLAFAGFAPTITDWGAPSDIRLAIIPIYSQFPESTLTRVITLVAADTVAHDRSNQPVRLAARLLDDAMQTSDSTQRMRLLQRVDRILMEDIGAFPLFRPIIHVCAKEEIRGLRFDKDGRIDLRNVYRVKLPADSTSSSP